MRVSAIDVVQDGESCQLQARVESDVDADDADWFAPFALWYRFPLWCEPFLSRENADPFLAALLVPAMQSGERLVVDAPVSARLLAALPEIQAIYTAFDPANRRIAVEAEARQTALPTDGSDPRAALFFSLGVDSWYSLLKNERDHPDDEKTVTHLISLHGIDTCHGAWDERFPAALESGFRRVAIETGKTWLPVVTNARSVTIPLAPWIMTHGAVLASVTLALGGALRRIMIAASARYDTLAPWGTHPLLDPLWSTEILTVVHDGCELDTIDKTRFVARYPLVLETLRPCARYGSFYNCGRCLKCLRTALDLLQAGMLGRCPTLPHEIDAELLRAVLTCPDGPVHAAAFRRRLEGLEASGDLPEVREILAEHLARLEGTAPAPPPRRRRGWRGWPWRGVA